MTLAEIRSAASVELGLRAETAGEKQTMIDRVANAAVLEILSKTRVRVTSATLSTTAGVGDYDLPVEALRVSSIEAPVQGGSSYSTLDHVSTDEILQRRRSGSSSSSASALRFALEGFNLLLLDPTPTTVYPLIMYYVPKPTRMTDGSHDPATIAFGGIPEEFHESVLLQFVYWKMGSQGEDQSSAQGARYKQDFDEGIREIRRRTNRRGGRLGPARTVFSRRPRRWAPDQA